MASVKIYGVDDRFWDFHREPRRSITGAEALTGAPLARDLATGSGDKLLIRVDETSPAVYMRAKVRDVLDVPNLGEFSIIAGQRDVFAAQGEERAAKGVADHLQKFWNPDMRRDFLAAAAKDTTNLHPAVKAALPLLKTTANS